jgi:hypothetical protein
VVVHQILPNGLGVPPFAERLLDELDELKRNGNSDWSFGISYVALQLGDGRDGASAYSQAFHNYPEVPYLE